MAEEFQESEVIFPDEDRPDKSNSNDYYFGCREMEVVPRLDRPNSPVSCNKNNNNNKANKTKQQRKMGSVPVNIPGYSNVFQFIDDDGFDKEDDGGELVPPHLMVGRRIEGKMAFSVCAGNGRTLKGRYLSEVRNSVLRMTGFLET